jgi:hypothetical protein
MNGKDAFRCLELEDKRVLHDQINTIAAIQSDGLVDNREWALPFKGEAMGFQLEAKALFVGRLKKARTERTVNLDGKADHLIC